MDGISTISGSRNPLQPADTSSEEPFTTYFDSKIPIPEDETVGASPAGNGVEKGLQALGARGEQHPWVPAASACSLGACPRGVSKLALGLMIHPR